MRKPEVKLSTIVNTQIIFRRSEYIKIEMRYDIRKILYIRNIFLDNKKFKILVN